MEKLLEVGTRYDHWNELLEVFRLAVDILKNRGESFLNEGDKQKKVKLESAIEMVESQVNRLSGLNTSFVPEWMMRDIFNQKDTRSVYESISANNEQHGTFGDSEGISH